MADKKVHFSKDENKLRTELLKKKLETKFPGKVKAVNVSGDDIEITADLTVAQWTSVKNKLGLKGFHLVDISDF